MEAGKVKLLNPVWDYVSDSTIYLPYNLEGQEQAEFSQPSSNFQNS